MFMLWNICSVECKLMIILGASMADISYVATTSIKENLWSCLSASNRALRTVMPTQLSQPNANVDTIPSSPKKV